MTTRTTDDLYSRAVDTNAIEWGWTVPVTLRAAGVSAGVVSHIPSGRFTVNEDGSITVTCEDDYYSGVIDRETAAGLLRALCFALQPGEDWCTECGALRLYTKPTNAEEG